MATAAPDAAMAAANLASQAEELEALAAIFPAAEPESADGGDALRAGAAPDAPIESVEVTSVTVRAGPDASDADALLSLDSDALEARGASVTAVLKAVPNSAWHVDLSCTLHPTRYPAIDPPSTVSATGGGFAALPAALYAFVSSGACGERAKAVHEEHAGDGSLFAWIEDVRQRIEDILTDESRAAGRAPESAADEAAAGAGAGAGAGDVARVEGTHAGRTLRGEEVEGRALPEALQRVCDTFEGQCEVVDSGVFVRLAEDVRAFVDATSLDVSAWHDATSRPLLPQVDLAALEEMTAAEADDPLDVPLLMVQQLTDVADRSREASGFILGPGGGGGDSGKTGTSDDKLFETAAEQKWSETFWQDLRSKATPLRELTIFTYGSKFMKQQPSGSQRAFNACVLNARGGGIDLRRARGTDPALQRRVCTSKNFERFVSTIVDIVERDDMHAISVFCSAGHHRSVAVAELLANHVYDKAETRHLTIKR